MREMPPNPALVQATADLLAARVALYKVQPGHDLIPKADAALALLLGPIAIIIPPTDDTATYVVSDERLAEIRGYLDGYRPAAGVLALTLAGAVYDLLAERDGR